MSSVVCPNCGRMNRVGAKVCAGCGKPLAIQAPPSPPPQQPVTPRQPPASPPPVTPPQQRVTPRQSPAQLPPTPTPPPRKPPTPPLQPARQQPTPGGKFKLSLKPWQYIAIGGIIIVFCLCALLANAMLGILKPGKPAPNFVPVPQTVIVTATLAPTIQPTVPTRVLPTLITEPTQVPKPSTTATSTPLPTAAATATPTVTQTPTDTSANMVLDADNKWRQQNLEMLVQNARFSNVTCDSLFEFDLSLENTEFTEVVIGWKGEEISVTDDAGRPYNVFYQSAPRDSRDCSKYKPIRELSQTALAAKWSYKIAVAVRGDLLDGVKEFYVTVTKVGTRIQNAKWKIVVRR